MQAPSIMKDLQKIYSQVNQSIVYLILKEFLNCSHIVKPHRYEKSAIPIFRKVQQLVQQLQSAITKYLTL